MTLQAKISATYQKLLHDKVLQPLSPIVEALRVKNFDVVFSITSNLESKPNNVTQVNGDAFHDPIHKDTFVCQLTSTHSVLLNKYNLFPEHALLVTTKFMSQHMPLDADDFAAISACLADTTDKICFFYNCGAAAGASQSHRHVHFFPYQNQDIPINEILQVNQCYMKRNTLYHLEIYPFRHCFLLLTSIDAKYLYRKYCLMMEYLNRDISHSFVMTRHWMLMVPRSRRDYQGIPLNSLAFVGNFLIVSHQHMATISEHGVIDVLQSLVAD